MKQTKMSSCRYGEPSVKKSCTYEQPSSIGTRQLACNVSILHNAVQTMHSVHHHMYCKLKEVSVSLSHEFLLSSVTSVACSLRIKCLCTEQGQAPVMFHTAVIVLGVKHAQLSTSLANLGNTHHVNCCRSCMLRGRSWQPRSSMPMQTQLPLQQR